MLARVFRPTLLNVLEITNLELGIIFSVYGIIAMISYFFGGPLADRFSPGKLMSIALIITALGGLFLATFPGISGLKVLYGLWGFSTILLFWAALIRATREWGGIDQQGTAFGILEGGRGLAAATVGSVAVFIFSLGLPSDVAAASLVERQQAFQYVIFFFSGYTLLVSILVWYALPSKGQDKNETQSARFFGLKKVMTMPALWLQSLIVVCAYVGYKTTDDISLYARDVLKYDSVQAAAMGSLMLWMRPIVAIISGFLGDRFTVSRIITWGFMSMILGGVAFGSGLFNLSITMFFVMALAATSFGVYSLRALYYALMDEGNIPLTYTGTAVGIISVIGYTPDVFFGPLMGYLLDQSPGVVGHQQLFLVMSLFGMIGLLSIMGFRKWLGQN